MNRDLLHAVFTDLRTIEQVLQSERHLHLLHVEYLECATCLALEHVRSALNALSVNVIG